MVNNNRNIYRITGILWILMVVSVFTAIIIVIKNGIELNQSDLSGDGVGNTLRAVAENSTAHIVELVFDVLSNVFVVAIAAMMYAGFSSYNKPLALVGTFCIAAGGTILATHDMGNFALTWIAKDYVAATGAKAMALEASASAMMLTAKWGVSIGSFFFVLGGFLYSFLILEISKPVGWLGVISGVLAFTATFIAWMGPEAEAMSMNLYMPLLIWQITIGIWLIRAKWLDHS